MGQREDTLSATRPCNIYRDVFGAWRWEFRDARGEAHDSLESFDTYEECFAAARQLGFTCDWKLVK